MTTPTNPQELFSPYLPAFVSVPEDEGRRRSFLTDQFSAIADVVNDKKIGAYTQSVSSQNGNKFSYDTTSKTRAGFQYLIRIVEYPDTGSLTLDVPPEMSKQFAVFNVWGSASKPPTTPGSGNYFSFYSEGNSKITFTFTDANITVTTVGLGTGYSGFLCIDFIADGM